MQLYVKNRHNGQQYKAEGEHWPEHGWHIKIYDFDPNAWGRSPTGVSVGPVIEQGWQHDLEEQGWEFPPLTQPENIRGAEMSRLAGLLGRTPQSSEAPPATPPATESKIDWTRRLKALKQRRGESADPHQEDHFTVESKAAVIVNRLLESVVVCESHKTFRQIKNEQDPDGTQHDLRIECIECGTSDTCRCSKPKRTFSGICPRCESGTPGRS